MGENSKIEWTHHTANLWHGCTKVHAGCDHCYAETLTKRWKRDIWGNDKPRWEIQSTFNDLDKYQRLAAIAGETQRVFVGSMMDIFEKPMPVINSKGELQDYTTGMIRQMYFDQVVPVTPNLLHLMLTKRPSNISKFIPDSWQERPLANVMYGTSPCDQKTFDTLWLQLARVNGKRFLSIEPLLGPVHLRSYCPSCNQLLVGSLSHRCGTCHTSTRLPDWVIVGGESGPHARPMHPNWVRSLRVQCMEADIPFFFKQWGEWRPANQSDYYDTSNLSGRREKIVAIDGTVHNYSFTAGNDPHVMLKVGKHDAGRLLDQKIHDEFPKLY